MSESIYCYPALIECEFDNSFTISFPDLKGCFSMGKSLSEAIINAEKALAIYINGNNYLPNPSEHQIIAKEYPNDIIQYIVVDIKKNIPKEITPIKKTLSIPSWLNSLSLKYHINFSSVLRDALKERLSELDILTESEKNMLLDDN